MYIYPYYYTIYYVYIYTKGERVLEGFPLFRLPPSVRLGRQCLLPPMNPSIGERPRDAKEPRQRKPYENIYI